MKSIIFTHWSSILVRTYKQFACIRTSGFHLENLVREEGGDLVHLLT